MLHHVKKYLKTGAKGTMVVLAVMAACASMGATDSAVAKHGKYEKERNDEEKWEFYGIIRERPANDLRGEWRIGDKNIVADNKTEFDLSEGPLQIGRCAKVKIRGGYVHEIESESMSDCR